MNLAADAHLPARAFATTEVIHAAVCVSEVPGTPIHSHHHERLLLPARGKPCAPTPAPSSTWRCVPLPVPGGDAPGGTLQAGPAPSTEAAAQLTLPSAPFYFYTSADVQNGDRSCPACCSLLPCCPSLVRGTATLLQGAAAPSCCHSAGQGWQQDEQRAPGSLNPSELAGCHAQSWAGSRCQDSGGLRQPTHP